MFRSSRDHLIVALDVPNAEEAISLVDALDERILWYKVGLELYILAGNDFVRRLVDRGKRVFLDLKLHDIPNTVAGAVRSAAQSEASLLTIHAAGGPSMIAAAASAASVLPNPPSLLAVTVLTSMDQAQLAGIGIDRTAAEQVSLLAAMSITAGASGLVCSAAEVADLRTSLGLSPMLVVPGIRPSGADAGDQKRTATPAAAITAGATYLVVGRPILQAENQVDAAVRILSEMDEAMNY